VEQKASGVIHGFSFNPNDLGDLQQIDAERCGISGRIMGLAIGIHNSYITQKEAPLVRSNNVNLAARHVTINRK
jgi:hypothetical protein